MISDNLREVRQEIQNSCALVGRNEDSVTLVAVTKTIDVEKTKDVLRAGVLNCAENRVEKFLEKKQEMTDFPQVIWHFIGNLQRRKVKLIINEIDYFHALDSLKLAGEIQKRGGKVIKCFVEVNISGESTKQGISPDQLSEFISELAAFDKIQVVGLMTMAPFDSTQEEQREIFRRLRLLQENEQKKQLSYAPCTELSMGMSNDYSVAIQEGATFIRVGTALVKDM
ncbi:YggS family pyridoxal phosphate-dependent enzyme [Enterococcus massiliensis]|uniref:YggS family pyridoxal phosphate-dependent enzyme n=1 Tax=Enterococcus massiliensis TaxID=1640685 RepID=UPI00065E1FAD|nr:YggS family pyridoxal phosphate-dependent enzyme [Enterococcus massiliensis]